MRVTKWAQEGEQGSVGEILTLNMMTLVNFSRTHRSVKGMVGNFFCTSEKKARDDLTRSWKDLSTLRL